MILRDGAFFLGPSTIVIVGGEGWSSPEERDIQILTY